MNQDHFAGANQHQLAVYGIAATLHQLPTGTIGQEAALIPWADQVDNLVDRHDARLLLEPLDLRVSRQPAAKRARGEPTEEQLDELRYKDLLAPPSASPPLPSDDDVDDDTRGNNNQPYGAVPFAYSNDEEQDQQQQQEKDDEGPVFVPSIHMPTDIRALPLPKSRKQYDIMRSTAQHIKNGGTQLEILLRVKQGDNPRFDFLLPASPLHAFFRWLVDSDESDALLEEVCAAPAVINEDDDDTSNQPIEGVDEQEQQEEEAEGGGGLASLVQYVDKDEEEQLKAMNKLVEYIKKNGDSFEAMVRTREANNPVFSFLNPAINSTGFEAYKQLLIQELGPDHAQRILENYTSCSTTATNNNPDSSNQQQPVKTSKKRKKAEPTNDEDDTAEAHKNLHILQEDEDQEEAKLAERRRRAQALVASKRRDALTKANDERSQQVASINTAHKRIFMEDDDD